jgi:hypothetical protein
MRFRERKGIAPGFCREKSKLIRLSGETFGTTHSRSCRLAMPHPNLNSDQNEEATSPSATSRHSGALRMSAYR